MRTTMLILLICTLTQNAAFGELTKQDVEVIQKVVKDEIAASEQRTSIKLAEINTEIKVIKTDINGVKDRLDDTHRLVLVLIALIGGTMAIAAAMTYAARKLAGAMTETQKHTESIKEHTERIEAQNAHLADLRAYIEVLNANIENSTEEPSNDSISHAHAD